MGDAVAKRIMCKGLKLYFRSKPRLLSKPPKRLVPSRRKSKQLTQFIPDLLHTNTIREIKKPFPPMFYSRLFSRPKKDGSLRPIIDLSALNRHLVVPKFRMQTVASIKMSLCKPQWACTADVTKAFNHVPINHRFHKYFAFLIGSGPNMRVYVFQYMPFGLSSAPWAFTRVMRPIKSFVREKLISLHSYLDDFAIFADSPKEVISGANVLKSTLQRLGFSINAKKSNFTPRQTIIYLGVQFNLLDLTLSLPREKILRITSASSEFMKRDTCSRRDMEQLVGLLNFAAYYVRLGRLHLLPLIRWMNRYTDPSSRDRAVLLDLNLRLDLQIWSNPSMFKSPVPMHIPQHTVELMTDASQTGWCGVSLPFRTREFWPRWLMSAHINWLELKAVHLSLIHFEDLVKDRVVLLLCDSTTALWCIKNQGTLRSDPLMSLTAEILELCAEWRVTLVPRHLRGVLNALADAGSRDSPVLSEWTLDSTTFRQVARLLPVFPQVDLCATRDNTQLRTFVSPCPDPLAVAMDATVVDWNRWRSVYLFPPTILVSKLIPKLEAFEGMGILIAPHIEGSLLSVALDTKCCGRHRLPHHASLSQTTAQGVVFHPEPAQFSLHAWIL